MKYHGHKHRFMQTAFAVFTFTFLLTAASLNGQVILGPNGPESAEQESGGDTAKPPPARPDAPHDISLKVTVAPPPEPALKWSLMPSYLEQKPGNSVPFYYRAVVSFSQVRPEAHETFNKNYDRWMGGTLTDYPVKEVEAYVGRFSHVVEELETAVHREKCDWDWRLRDLKGTAAIAFLLPEVQSYRELARILSLKARLEIIAGRHEDALKTLMVGLQLARDVAEPPTLINDLVGAAIASIMVERLIELIDSPGSPNLYWALAELPRPLIDMRPAMQYEMHLPLMMFPFLKEAENEQSADQWKELIFSAGAELAELGEFLGDSNEKTATKFAALGLVLEGYPRAKRELIESGMPKEKVEAMSVGLVIAVYQQRIYRHMASEMYKWTLLPYDEAWRQMRTVEEELINDRFLGPPGQTKEVIPIVSLLFPAVHRANHASVRLDSRLAALRAIEAIRMHAAVKGRLPAVLEDVTIVPVPKNPIYGKPFTYRFDGRKAILEAADLPGEPLMNTWRFQIEIE